MREEKLDLDKSYSRMMVVDSLVEIFLSRGETPQIKADNMRAVARKARSVLSQREIANGSEEPSDALYRLVASYGDDSTRNFVEAMFYVATSPSDDPLLITDELRKWKPTSDKPYFHGNKNPDHLRQLKDISATVAEGKRGVEVVMPPRMEIQTQSSVREGRGERRKPSVKAKEAAKAEPVLSSLDQVTATNMIGTVTAILDNATRTLSLVRTPPEFSEIKIVARDIARIRGGMMKGNLDKAIEEYRRLEKLLPKEFATHLKATEKVIFAKGEESLAPFRNEGKSFTGEPVKFLQIADRLLKESRIISK